VEVAQYIVDELDADVSVDIEPNRTGEVGRYVADISKAQKILDYNPEYNIKDGLAATIDWYRDRTELFETILS
jgi:UDP-glucose 4-epimerase